MTPDKIKRIHMIYGILLSVVTVIAGICLIVSCYSIYHTGIVNDTQPYSPEIVASAFSRIALPVYLCLALIVGGFILHIALPPQKKKPAVEKNQQLILERLYAKTDLSQCDEAMRCAIEKQKKNRRLHSVISAVLLVIGCVIFLSYACNGNHWHNSQINASMSKAVLILFACLAIPFGYSVFTAYYHRRSLGKEIELMRQASNVAGRKPEKAAPKASNARKILIARCVFLVLGIGILLFGYFTGGMADVLTKAINICTECVGLG